jgi:hypothetical protein
MPEQLQKLFPFAYTNNNGFLFGYSRMVAGFSFKKHVHFAEVVQYRLRAALG